MRGRPATPLGTWGTINATKTDHGWQASTYMRLYTGKSVRVRASAKTKTAAISALKARCAQRLQANDTDTLTSTSTLNQLIEAWIDSKDDVTAQTIERYKTAHKNTIRDGIGEVRLNELTPSIMHAWSQATPPGVASNAMSVLKGSLNMAVVYGLMPTSPLNHVPRKKTRKKPVDALAPEQVPKFRKAIRDYASTCASPHTADLLRDVIDMALSTGLRLGEILAIRWEDIDGDKLHVRGTIVYTKESGVHRQAWTKTESSTRTIRLGSVARGIVERRRKKNWMEYTEMLFPSVHLTYMEPNNFNRLLRKARGEEWDWVTIHTLRRTVATIIDRELGPKQASRVLGHSDMGLTQRVYVAKNDNGVEIGEVIDRVVSAD